MNAFLRSSLFALCCAGVALAGDRLDRRPDASLVYGTSYNSGGTRDASFVNATTSLNGNAVITARCLVLDGSGDYAEAADNANQRSYPITFACWFNMQGRDQTYGAALFSKYAAAGASNGWMIYTDTSEQIIAFYGNGAANWISDAGLGTGTGYKAAGWHHVAVVINASGGIIYIDGVSKDTNAWTGTPQATTSTEVLRLGRFGSGNYFNGDLDDPQIYNRALTAAEVMALYSEGRP